MHRGICKRRRSCQSAGERPSVFRRVCPSFKWRAAGWAQLFKRGCRLLMRSAGFQCQARKRKRLEWEVVPIFLSFAVDYYFFCRLFVYCYTLTHSLTHTHCLSFFISFSSVTMREPMLLSSTGAHGGPGVGRSVQQGISRDFRGLTSSECTGIRWFSRRRLPWERSEKGFVLHCHALFILSFFMLACLLDLRSLSPFVLSCSRRGWSWGKGWREE